MKTNISVLAILATSFIGLSDARSAILIGSDPITLNFNNLNSNFGGGYSSTGGSSTFPISTTTGTAPIAIYSGEGGVEFTVSTNDFSPGGIYSNTGTYSNSNSVRLLQDGTTSDYAIGLKDSSDRSFVLAVKNDTGATVGKWNIDYFVEQYSTGASATTIVFSYSLNGTTFITTNLAGAAIVTADTTTVVDGNLADVISTARSGVVTESVSNGSEIYFRWTYDHQSGTSTHLGIDDITIAAVPEPAAAVLGALGLLGLLRRRR